MPDPAFAQPERRSFLVPILGAIAAIAVAVAIAIHFFPATTIDLDHLHTDVVPTETVFKGGTVVGLHETNRVLFVVSTVRVSNRMRVPIFLDDFHLTLTDTSDAEMTVRGATKDNLPGMSTSFPALKPVLGSPLLRDTSIEPGKSAEGTVIFALDKINQDLWDKRKSAVIKVDIYHQPAVYATIPK